MPNTNIEYTVSSALTRTMRIKLILLCAAGFLLFLSGFQFLSRQYLRYTSIQAENKYYISRANNFKFNINFFLNKYRCSNIDQLSLNDLEHKMLYSAPYCDFLYAGLYDLNGHVISHPHRSQEGLQINTLNSKNLFPSNIVQNSTVNVNGTIQKVCDITLPFILNGTTQGVIRAGYARNRPRPPLYTEVMARKAIRYAGIVLVVFIALAIVLIWVVSLFLENNANMISREQQKTNRLQLEIIGAGIVHEVKNSLNGIRMNIQMLQDKFIKLPPELKESFSNKAERIQREAGRTSDMLNEFLTYAKPGRFDPKPTNLSALLNEIAQSFEPECEKRNVKLICNCSPEMSLVIADSRRLRHGISNLLLNSFEAVNKNGNIILKGELSNDKVKISVEDNGGGMNAEAKKKSFEVFYSTKPQGSGLGLSIVKKVALSHGGKVIVDNFPNKGCKFTIVFPVIKHKCK